MVFTIRLIQICKSTRHTKSIFSNKQAAKKKVLPQELYGVCSDSQYFHPILRSYLTDVVIIIWMVKFMPKVNHQRVYMEHYVGSSR